MVEILPHWVSGVENGHRVESRLLEERLQAAVDEGYRFIKVEAQGQHGLGGRLWKAGDQEVLLKLYGPTGQRVGSMGFPNTRIEVMGPASDDVGWLNAGAEIIVHGQAANGVGNAMAQGRISIGGNIGSRGMTMTKQNPRFAPPELWVLGSAGDYFAEFMAGGVAVVCGLEAQNPNQVLGYRPGVGMVGGRIFFRGPAQDYSRVDAREVEITDQDWAWLTDNLAAFLERINRAEDFGQLADRDQWRLLAARGPRDRAGAARRSLSRFRSEVWDAELGSGGLIGDLTTADRSQVPIITTGDLRRREPRWLNRTLLPPCQDSCPTGIPVQERWRLIRAGKLDEAIDLALQYTPFPATVCGYLCPNLCLAGCTRTEGRLPALDVARLGRESLAAADPDLPLAEGKRVAIIGGGPAGLSTAWQLRRMGHRPVIFDRGPSLGGKISRSIPASRIPDEVLRAELDRAVRLLERVELDQERTGRDFEQLTADYEAVVLAVGATRPRTLPVEGGQRAIPALTFLEAAKADRAEVGKQVVIIGAGNVGCDAASEAARLGAEKITLIDIQAPASFGHERQAAEAAGAQFLWPVATERITDQGVELKDGRTLAADTVIVAIGDAPDLGFLPQSIALDRGFIKVDGDYRTSLDNVFAVGDAVRPGLLTEAIGAGRRVAEAIDGQATEEKAPRIDYGRVKLAYFEPNPGPFTSLEDCAQSCSSCGVCRDCRTCLAVCPTGAITRQEAGTSDGFEYVVDGELCIGCGFCAGACPCGVWTMVATEPGE